MSDRAANIWKRVHLIYCIFSEWLVAKKIKKMSLVIKNIQTKETIECWDFNIQYEDGVSTVQKGLSKPLNSIGE